MSRAADSRDCKGDERMIVLNCHLGRMSNLKLMKAHVIAHALARGERWRVASDNWFWRSEAKTLGRVWNKCVRMMKPAEGSRNRCFRLPWLTIVHGFTELRDFEAMRRHGDEIRQIFLTQRHRDAEVAEAKVVSEGKKIVGVHVRRTDYREWQGGRYCYSNSVYERVIDEMRRLVDGVRFAVFTDEPESLSPQLSQFNSQPTTPERDQWLMSKCAYLIGPPSTFTTWASFMGKVPLLYLMTREQEVRLCDFIMRW